MQGTIEILARTPLPTAHGDFECIAFRHVFEPDAVHVALVHGDPAAEEAPPVRVHSECFTDEVLDSIKCDCRHQLAASLGHIAEHGSGALVYLRQEGRGIGLVGKLLAYELQHAEGLDTVDANRRLGLPDDARGYEAAAAFLKEMGLSSVALLTNNPAKVEGLESAGLEVVERLPVLTAATEEARQYLATKIARMGHLLEAATGPPRPSVMGKEAGEGPSSAREGRTVPPEESAA